MNRSWVAIFLLTTSAVATVQIAAADPFQLVGYLPDYRSVTPEAVVRLTDEGLTDLIYFSVEPDETGHLKYTGKVLSQLGLLRQLKKARPFRLLLCVGGWERSAAFMRVASHPDLRARLVAEVSTFCVENDLDGVDLDWEHPHGEEEIRDFTTLLCDLKPALASRKLLLTVALADPNILEPKAVEVVDRIHLMAYDGPDHGTREEATWLVTALLDHHVPARKICLGVPCYGRKRTEPRDTLSYADLVTRFHPKPEADEAGGFFFNGVSTVRRKTRFARDHHLAGMMVWELTQDSAEETSLWKAICDESKR